MIAFEVYLNGEKLCTAGLRDLSVLTAILNWRQRQADASAANPEELEAEDFRLYVGGMLNIAEGSREFLRWLDLNLEVGNEITIKIVDANTVDIPIRREKVELNFSPRK
ncbi:hypothetical protein H6G17_18140 [Chroococcidiopsis sp. FACHB-1243]|uniref:hypothetical protein n=1 Tax=Chroococcidiopsis sp. [FACHB-1243] TaxID=2692781 RepID=UPI00177E2FCE|nr:hypothetical protein [Chroococcidiopsis sp. [FACHB-1243]]MBD2307400.1 hypothetical protein [Chroococcidiopsis sp. [FACHB-1243]]